MRSRAVRSAHAATVGPSEGALEELGLPGSDAPQKQTRGSRATALSVVLQLAAMTAIGMLVYPDAASWISRIGHNAEISGYVRQVEATVSEERSRILDAGYAYNELLEPGPLTDPYISIDEDEALRNDKYLAYEEMLRVSGTDAIGTIYYPRLDIGLPAYHGTSDEVISKGIGHMYGTSLPIGGPSTRSVLTAHSGLSHAKLFTELPKAQVGDLFWISVLGEDHYYRVEKTEVVLPSETESFEIIEGEDWVTLFTCTPVGVNSHRFLVHAVRIDNAAAPETLELGGDGVKLGVPWWALWFVGGSAATALLLFAPVKPRKRRV